MMSIATTLVNPCPKAKTLTRCSRERPATSQYSDQRRRTIPHSPHLTLPLRCRLPFIFRCSSDQAAGEPFNIQDPNSQIDTGNMRSRLAKLGLAAVLAYGLFDAVTYTTFFVLAFLGYEKSTGKNPAANLQALLGIVILMWTGNNITRPFRVAGAAALAPVIDSGLKRIQKYFDLPNLVFAFALVASIVAVSCFTVVGILILSRWGR